MTKAEIIAEISNKTGLEKVDVQETVEAFFKVVKNAMIGGENVYVRGFGSFVVKKRAAKTARNISRKIRLLLFRNILFQVLNRQRFLWKKLRTEIKNNLSL